MGIKATRWEDNVLTQTHRVADASAAVSKYDAVKLVGGQSVALTDTVGEAYYGIATGDADPGDDVPVALMGKFAANVANPDGVVAANTPVIPSGNPGELRPPNTGGATGEADGEYRTTTEEDGDGLATLLLR